MKKKKTNKRIAVAQRKLFETTNYLITISIRLTGDMKMGIGKEMYFISEDVKDALKNIGTKDSRFFAKEIEKAKLQNRFETST